MSFSTNFSFRLYLVLVEQTIFITGCSLLVTHSDVFEYFTVCNHFVKLEVFDLVIIVCLYLVCFLV